MKKNLLILGFLIGIGTCLFAQSNAPSDQTINTNNKKAQTLELIAIFNDAIDVPTKYNAYVKPYLQDVTFPKKQNATKQEYDNLLEEWIVENPTKIKKLLADRQKAHNELYGPRK